MEWIKVGDQWPLSGSEILYYDGENISLCWSEDKDISSVGYYCNKSKDDCSWIYDDCGCSLMIKDNDYWMYLPEVPKNKGD